MYVLPQTSNIHCVCVYFCVVQYVCFFTVLITQSTLVHKRMTKVDTGLPRDPKGPLEQRREPPCRPSCHRSQFPATEKHLHTVGVIGVARISSICDRRPKYAGLTVTVIQSHRPRLNRDTRKQSASVASHLAWARLVPFCQNQHVRTNHTGLGLGESARAPAPNVRV